MKEAQRHTPQFAALGLCMLLTQCAPPPGVSVKNSYTHPIERVVIRDAKGVACQLENIAPNATVQCAGRQLSTGEVTYELRTASFTRSGLLGFANAGNGGSRTSLSLELTKEGKIATGGTAISFRFSGS